MQVLQRRWDPTFSEHSHGFRPRRSAHQAVAKAQQYIAAGHRWVVDIDLEKFFDRVNHDRLMAARKERRKAGPYHLCCRISCSMNSTGSWSGASTAL